MLVHITRSTLFDNKTTTQNQSVKSSSVVVNAQFRKSSVSSPFLFARVIKTGSMHSFVFTRLYMIMIDCQGTVDCISHIITTCSIIVAHLFHSKWNVFEGLLYLITNKLYVAFVVA